MQDYLLEAIVEQLELTSTPEDFKDNVICMSKLFITALMILLTTTGTTHTSSIILQLRLKYCSLLYKLHCPIAKMVELDT